jgi:DNA-binding NarL/FixJ family response regulator
MAAREPAAVAAPIDSILAPRRRPLALALLAGFAGGVLIAVLKLVEYRFLVVEHSVEIYGGLVAALFAGVGIGLGRTLAPRRSASVAGEPRTEASFPSPPAGLAEQGVTPREREILGLIAAGLSNREIAERLCVSENTVKTHSSRVFAKLGARRRTEAVRIGKASGLIP